MLRPFITSVKLTTLDVSNQFYNRVFHIRVNSPLHTGGLPLGYTEFVEVYFLGWIVMKVKAILIVTIMVLSILPYTHETALKSDTISSSGSSSADVAVTQLDVTTPSVYVGTVPTVSPINHIIRVTIVNFGGTDANGTLILSVNDGSSVSEVDSRDISISSGWTSNHLMYWDATTSSSGISLIATWTIDSTESDSNPNNDQLVLSNVDVADIEDASHVADTLPDNDDVLAKGLWSGTISMVNSGFILETGFLSSLTGEVFIGLEGASHASLMYRTESNKPYNLTTFGFDWPTVFQAKTTIGLGMGLAGATSLPFYNKYFAGGNTTVRGFKGSSLGPLTYNAPRTDPLPCAAKAVPNKFMECDAVGGDFLTSAQFNWIFSPPAFLGEETRGLRGTLFVDIGQVFEKVNNFEYNELRASYGIEFNVLTPIGGVTVGFVDTLKTKDGDDTQPVVFQLGGNF